jgi:predicted lipoprotein with Yx(FWY)xxD motif/uncharacterized membrane protein YozB (DUF420 family)
VLHNTSFFIGNHDAYPTLQKGCFIVDYLNPPGFLGTGASLLADVTLIAYILLIVPGMVLGYIFARTNRHRPHHRNLMIGITAVNWLLILWVMVAAFNFDVAANIGAQPSNPRYLYPSIHSALGLVAQLLATYIIFRMIREDVQVAAAKARGEDNLSRYWFTSAKPTMRLVLALWLVTAVLGFVNYVVRYNVVNLGGAGGEVVATEEAAPLATEDAAPVEASEEAAPAATDAPVAETEEAASLAETAEAAPVVETEAAAAVAVVSTAAAAVVATEEVGVAETAEAAPPPATAPVRPTAAPPTPASPAGATVTVAARAHPTLGNILVDGNGRTLYVYANDEPGWSNCVNACLNNWEVYVVDRNAALTLASGLAGELGLVQRADGTFQVMYNTQPLYRFALDRRPGDASGNGAGNLWSVVRLSG